MKNRVKEEFLKKNYSGVVAQLDSIEGFEVDGDLLFYYLVSANELFVETRDARFLNKAQVAIRRAEPMRDASLLRLASLTYLHSEDYGDAIAEAKRAQEIDPSPSTYIALGNAYRALKEFDNAVIFYKKAIHSESFVPEINLFELYQQLNEKGKAQEVALSILEKIKTVPDSELYTGLVDDLLNSIQVCKK